MQPLLSIRNVTKRFGGVTALNDVSFDIQPGAFHAIVGENGAGKSTLMKILSGVIPEFEGEILLRGEPTRFSGTRDAEHAGVAIIHQELNLVEQLSVAANIFLGREKRGALGLLDDRAMEAAASELFERLGCRISPTQHVSELRVGDQQLVEIAKALSLDADILIMDEPTSALTEGEVERLFGVIERLRQRGVTILYISHKMDEVFRLSDQITVLRDGRFIATKDRSQVVPKEVTHLLVGREIDDTSTRVARQPGEVLLQVRHLNLPRTGHAQQWRLNDINFELRRGEVLGIAGLMGAGRTELLECLFGISPEPPTGDVLLAGQPLYVSDPTDAMRAGLALVTEDRKRLGLFGHLSVRENITVCTLLEMTKLGLLSSRIEAERAQQAIARLRVKTANAESPILSLSGGNQQKCIIARWLETKPTVLLLDDPTRGIDVGAKSEIYAVIDQLCREGLGIIVTSSELPELITVCDRIMVLCEGRLTGSLTRGNFTEQAIMEAATQRA